MKYKLFGGITHNFYIEFTFSTGMEQLVMIFLTTEFRRVFPEIILTVVFHDNDSKEISKYEQYLISDVCEDEAVTGTRGKQI
jgi:hypothetical protein